MGFLRRALSPDGHARLVTVDITSLLQDLLNRCKLYPPSAVHVGQGAMGALMLQALGDTDENDKVECQWSCVGPFGNLYADALGTGKIRVSISNPRVEIPSLSESLGRGLFQVRRLRAGLETSVGIVESSGHVGEDLSLYLRQSEQRLSGICLSVKMKSLNVEEAATSGLHPEDFPFVVEKAAGFLVDILGDNSSDNQNTASLWWQAQMDVLGSISEWALSDDPKESTLEMLKMLTMKEHVKITLESDVQSFCTCSLDKAVRAIKLLSTGEQQSLIQSDGNALQMDCEYCGKSYSVALSDLAVKGS